MKVLKSFDAKGFDAPDLARAGSKMASFALDEYKPLCAEDPSLGRVAVLPWDRDIFGFAVADYRPPPAAQLGRNIEAAVKAIAAWAKDYGAELISSSVAADDGRLMSLMGPLGFRFVDYSLTVGANLQRKTLPEIRLGVRQALPDDWDDVERIAESAFDHGRYHADPCFPRAMADLRYRRWMEKALRGEDAAVRVYVIGSPGAVRGFFHVELKGGVADLRLGAVDRADETGLAGFYLYAGTLSALKKAGVKKATAKISAGNTAVMNIYAALGFTFSHPEAVLHWHAPGSRHLCGPES
jgi:hypothetical protein